MPIWRVKKNIELICQALSCAVKFQGMWFDLEYIQILTVILSSGRFLLLLTMSLTMFLPVLRMLIFWIISVLSYRQNLTMQNIVNILMQHFNEN